MIVYQLKRSCLTGRNRVAFNNIVPSYHGLWNRVDLYRLEFAEVQQKNMQNDSLRAARWTPPQSEGSYKLNVAFS